MNIKTRLSSILAACVILSPAINNTLHTAHGANYEIGTDAVEDCWTTNSVDTSQSYSSLRLVPCAYAPAWQEFARKVQRADLRLQMCLNDERIDHLDRLSHINNGLQVCSAAVGTTLLYCMGSSASQYLGYYPGPMPVLTPTAFAAAQKLPAPKLPTSCFGVALFEQGVCWAAFGSALVLEAEIYEKEERVCQLNRNQEANDAAQDREKAIRPL